jgi:hypothetical protein
MHKELCFLISLVLLFGLCVSAQAEPIEVNNFSFELDVDGNQILGHTGMAPGEWPDVGVLGWTNVGDYIGVDVQCGDACATPEHCYEPNTTDGIAVCYFQTNDIYFYQVLNHNIVGGKRYTLTFDAMSWDNATVVPSFFYPEDGNYPDVNHIELTSKSIWLAPEGYPDAVDANKVGFDYDANTLDRTLTLVVAPGAAYAGKLLGIKFYSPIPDDDDDWQWGFIDNVRVDSVWSSGAWNPSPADGAKNISRDVILSWTPGLWAAKVNGHEVYFGTSFSAVNDANTSSSEFMGGQDSNDFNDFTTTLKLAKTYYWRVDEVNESYSGTEPPTPPGGRWKGDVWSFSTNDGTAFNPLPANGSVGVRPDVILSWRPGIDANSHDVYIGIDKDAVRDANRLSSEYGGQQNYDANTYDTGLNENLELGRTYYWRIDEVNNSGIAEWPGHVWQFRVIGHLDVDDFDSYSNQYELWAIWDDYWVNGTGSQIFVERGVVFTPDGNSIRYSYSNTTKSGGKYVGSRIDADVIDLEIGEDWTIGSVQGLVVYFYGDTGNTPTSKDMMYVALDDGSKKGVVKYAGDMNDIKEAKWHEWNIDIGDFSDLGVVLSSINRVHIGFGGYAWTGQTAIGSKGKVYFDDIATYPARCVTSIAHSSGNFDFDEDCYVDYLDIQALARDWLMSGGWAEAGPPDANFLEAWYEFEDGYGITASDSSGNNRDGNLVHMDAVYDWTTGYIGDALEFDGVDDYVEFPSLNLDSNTVTMSAWIEPNGLQAIFAGVVFCRDDADNDGAFSSPADTAAGLAFSYAGGWAPTLEISYNWNDEWWNWHSGLEVPDGQWSFVAIVVEPTQATLYMYENGSLSEKVNAKPHAIEQFGGIGTIAYDNSLGTANERNPFNGKIDDVRIYNKALTRDEILYLCQGPGMVYVPLAEWRADANKDDVVDFKDYAIMADNWLKELLFP